MVAILATQWDKFISSTLSGTCCPMDPYFISSTGPWICFPSTRGGTGESPPPTTPARMAGDLSSCHDSGRSYPRHQALRWPCGTCGACLVSAPEKCSMSMWVVWKRQTSRPFKNAMGFWSLFHPLLLGSPVTLSAIVQSSLLVTFGLSSGLWWGSKCHKKHRYCWVLCQKAFATWLFFNGWCPKLSIVWQVQNWRFNQRSNG